MRLRRLELEYFAGIGKANIRFGPGLNLLYGPNELGKSTLLKAIRAALLLPVGARAHEDFVDWHSGESPSVTLEFETEPNRIWRVKKRYAQNSSSLLEFSKDGVTYSSEARGREVDGRLRELLEWGLAPPGGTGRQKGFPRSFLTVALLGEQGEVDRVLSEGLDDDADESGRKRLTAALQALAEDPLFRDVLNRTQTVVGEAYTSTGRKSTRRGSPWNQLQESRRAAELRRAEVRQLAESSESAVARIAEQRDAVDQSRQALIEAEGLLNDIELAWKQGVELDSATQRAAEARAAVERVQSVLDAVAATAGRLTEARRLQETLDRETARADEALAAAESRRRSAVESLRDLQGDDVEKSRKLREQELENTLLGLAARRQRAETRIERASHVRERVRKTTAQEDEVAKLTVQLAKQTKDVAEREAAIERATRARLAHAWREAEVAVKRAREVAGGVQEAQTRVAELRAAAADMRNSVEARNLPDPATMGRLRELATDLRVAEEGLAVGLSVALEPKGPLVARVTTDGNVSELKLTDKTQLTATAELALDLPDVLVRIRGGSESSRARALELRRNWQAASGPVFAATGAGSLDELARVLEEADNSIQRSQALSAEATTLDARSAGAGDVTGALREAEEQYALAEANLLSVLPEGTALDAVDCANTDPARLEAEITRGRSEVETAKGQCAHAAGLLESQRAELAALRREHDTAADALGGDWSTMLEGAARELGEIEEQLKVDTIALDELRESASTQVGEAEATRAAAEKEHQSALAGLAKTREAKEAGQRQLARLEGELAQLEAAAADENIEAARAESARCDKALADVPRPSQSISDEQRAQAREFVMQEQEVLRSGQDELRRSEGALEQVGGNYIEEELKQAEEAVRAIEEREREKDLDYGAWKLLLETLKEAEGDATVHLGKALIEPLTARMAQLTGGRYGSPAIGPKLGTDAISVAGTNRPLDALSVGAREQLATLFRLIVAERLGTVVVLDDQLVQSDAERMRFFAQLMLEFARESQILILTCQPDAYDFQAEDGVTVTELEKLIVRSGEAPGPL